MTVEGIGDSGGLGGGFETNLKQTALKEGGYDRGGEGEQGEPQTGMQTPPGERTGCQTPEAAMPPPGAAWGGAGIFFNAKH